MKTFISVLLVTVAWVTYAQTKVTEKVSVRNETRVELDFDFADDIEIKTWDKPEVLVEVSVMINDGEDDGIFELISEKLGSSVLIRLNTDKWKNVGHNRNCGWNSELLYTVYMPGDMELKAKTISGNFKLQPMEKESIIKTISGDIDITVPAGLDFKAKTISGEIYSDLDISYPEGKEGLKQIVGMNVKGHVDGGSSPMELETISGNIYLRRG